MRNRILLLILFMTSAFAGKAQNLLLTIGEAFNWQVGDTLIYRSYSWAMVPQPFQGAPDVQRYYYGDFTGFEVISKSAVSDTLVYTIQYFDKLTSDTMMVINPDSVIDSLHYVGALSRTGLCLDYFIGQSCIWGCNKDTVGSINGNPVVSVSNSWLDVIMYFQIVNNIGIKYSEVVTRGFEDRAQGCGAALAYYKSDSIEWRDQTVYNWVGINEVSNEPLISVYPNPVSDVLYIDSEEPVSKLAVYNLSGQMELSLQPFASEVNVSLLPAGSYTINVETPSKNVVRRRFIKL